MTLPVSVVIPCYRQEQWLQGAVDSVKDCADDVTVIYDNGVHGYWGDYAPNVGAFSVGGEFYRDGVCTARNMGIEMATNDLIFCLDADDRLYPGALQRMFEAWQPGMWIYGERYTEIAEDESIIREMTTPPPGLIFRKNLSFASILFHRDDWKRVGGYDPNYEWGDEDYCFQVALTDTGIKPVQLKGEPIYRRMIHQNSRTARAIKYFPMVLEMLREQYPNTMKP